MSKLKIGVFGAGRGVDIAKNFKLLGCEIVALCDFHEKRRKNGLEQLGGNIPSYENFDEFINCDMDAMIIANYFHEHAPYVIKCFEKNIHVFCECLSNGTMAEGVELVRAFKKTKSIFMLAENYPQMLFNREMKKVCDSGTLGKILYAEGEYNHPISSDDYNFYKSAIYFTGHWRNYVPRSYYITHSLAPLMWSTKAMPQKVLAVPVFAPIKEKATARHVGDRAAVIVTVNNDGSVFRFTGCAAFGAHHNAYRICGENGQIENIRGMNPKVMLRYNAWSVPEGKEETNLYEPCWNDSDEDAINNAGHGGGDYIVARMFADCVEKGQQPEFPYDLHSAVAMSSTAILSHRSILNGYKCYDIPDFTNEECCNEYENDRETPFYSSDGKSPTIPCSSVADYAPAREQIDAIKKILNEE